MSPEKGGGNEKNMRDFSKKRPTSAEWVDRWFMNANITLDELTIMIENDTLKVQGLSPRQQEVVRMFLQDTSQKLSVIAKNLIPPISESAQDTI